MPKVTAHENLRAVLTTLRNRAGQSHAANPPHWAQASIGSRLLEANAKKINLDLSKLNIHRPSLAEIALRERAQKVQAKSTPYASRHGVSGVELNGRVQVPVKPGESSERGSESVVCRHFATMFLQHGGKKSKLMQVFSTEAGIAEKFDGKLAEIDVGIKKAIKEASAGCKHLVNSEQLGSYLQALAMQLQAPGSGGGPSEANCLLETADHAMALHVERKRKDGVGYFCAKLYDPNDTATYKRVVTANPEDFGSLKLKDMMIRPELISFYSNGANMPLPMMAVSLDHRLQPPMDRSSTTASAENMFLALQKGLLCDLRLMLKTALEGTPVSNEGKELLRAHHLGRGADAFPGLYIALEDGQSDAVKVFTEAVLASDGLNLQEKVDLLAAKRSDGMPGLYAALQIGHSGAVKAFTEAVLASDGLNQQEKVDLLAAKRSDGVPGMHVALEFGSSGAVKAFTESVLASDGLNQQEKVDLLEAKRSDGAPGLYLALQNGHSGAVKAFTQEVLASQELSPQEQFDLLAANFNGTPGLFSAFAQVQTDTVKVFVQEVLASSLSLQVKVGLLAAKRSDGIPGLCVALHYGDSGVVKVFAQEVLASRELNPQQKFDLLAADFNGTPGLYSAFQRGHTETVKVFAREVLASEDLTPQAKVDLLAAKLKQALPGLSMAGCNGHDETVSVFTQIVQQSALDEAQKAELLRVPSMTRLVF